MYSIWGGMKNSNTYLCIPDRKVWKSDSYFGQKSFHCPKCGNDGLNMGTKWRAPRLTNKSAWRSIEQGDYWWDMPVAEHATTFDAMRRKNNKWRDGNKKTSAGIPKSYRWR